MTKRKKLLITGFVTLLIITVALLYYQPKRVSTLISPEEVPAIYSVDANLYFQEYKTIPPLSFSEELGGLWCYRSNFGSPALMEGDFLLEYEGYYVIVSPRGVYLTAGPAPYDTLRITGKRASDLWSSLWENQS